MHRFFVIIIFFFWASQLSQLLPKVPGRQAVNNSDFAIAQSWPQMHPWMPRDESFPIGEGLPLSSDIYAKVQISGETLAAAWSLEL